MNIDRMIQSALEFQKSGDLIKAENIYREILKSHPDNFLIYYHLGNVLRDKVQLEEAILFYKRSLQLNPNYFEGNYMLATILQEKEDFDQAITFYKKAIELNPDFPGSYHNVGKVFQQQGKLDQAIFYYQKASELNPNFASYYNLGEIFYKKGQPQEAVRCYYKTLEFDRNNEWIYFKLGNTLKDMRQLEDAIACYTKALQINPNFTLVYVNLGNVLREMEKFDEAFQSYERAVQINPDLDEANYNIGVALLEQGQNTEALAIFDRILKKTPDFLFAQWAKCISQLSVIYPDLSSIGISRNNYRQELLRLRKIITLKTPQNINVAAEAVGNVQPFFLAAQGLNNRDLQKLYGDLVCRIMAKRYPQFSQRPAVPLCSDGEPLRIGIVSAYFHYHSIWKIPLRGWVENLDKDRFHIYGYYTGKIQDHVTEVAKRHCHRFIEDVYSFEDLCQIIRNDNLHVLLYPEIGMDPMTLRLAALKLAPIQCTSLGHPDTSGLPTIDYYLSSDLMEPPDAGEHYTEKLIRLPNLGFCYTPPDVPSVEVSRATFGLSQESVLYLCSHALFTYLPQYDDIYPKIAQNVKKCHFLFICSQKSNIITEQFSLRIKNAFQRYNLNADEYVVILPRLNQEQYHALNCVSDIFLDTIGWSANNSTFEAIACNLPVVTLPGELMRQRHCSGILTMMGLTETITSSIEKYIELAIRLGNNSELRHQISEKIEKNKHLLYRDRACITNLEKFIENMARERQHYIR